MNPVVLVTGASGLIGQYLLRTASRWAPQWDVRGWTHADHDVTDLAGVTAAWRALEPCAVVHCAALSRTQACERHPDLARRINVEATAHLAELARDVPFMFLSSGEVFDGQRAWYTETDEARPINVYGRTKLDAEQAVRRHARHTVLRIVLTAGTSRHGDRSFVEDMCRTARAGQNVTLYADEFRCPLPAGVIARVIWELLGRDQPGLYHVGGTDRLSRWDIGEALRPWYPELDGRLVKGSARTHTGGPRPLDVSLCCDKIQALLSFPLPAFRSWLAGRCERGTDLWDYPNTSGM